MGRQRGGLYLWANERLSGRLDGQLVQWRADGLTLDQIVDELRDLDLEISRETVRRWMQGLPQPEPSEAA